MIEVYVVTAGLDYEGTFDSTIKVFSDKEKAKTYRVSLPEKEGYDNANIYMKTVIS